MRDPETPADIFKRLLFELRRLWSDLQGIGLYFEIFCPDSHDSSNPDSPIKELANLCFVNLPLTSTVSDFTISPGWVFVHGLQRNDARIDRLRNWCREAGTHLPSDYLIWLRGYTHLINDPASLWIALLCYVHRIHMCQCQRQSREEHAGQEWKVWSIAEHIMTDPVQSSIELIEQLRLNTENPVPLHELEIERPWPPDADCRDAVEPPETDTQQADSVVIGELRRPDSGPPGGTVNRRRRRVRRQSQRRLTEQQDRILKIHKPGHRHEATARLAEVFDKFGEPDVALVRSTLKAASEFKARQESRR